MKWQILGMGSFYVKGKRTLDVLRDIGKIDTRVCKIDTRVSDFSMEQ